MRRMCCTKYYISVKIPTPASSHLSLAREIASSRVDSSVNLLDSRVEAVNASTGVEEYAKGWSHQCYFAG
jgi:hypothetical protein